MKRLLAFLRVPKNVLPCVRHDIIGKLAAFAKSVKIEDWPRGSRGPEREVGKPPAVMLGIFMNEANIRSFELLTLFVNSCEDLRDAIRLKSTSSKTTLNESIMRVSMTELSEFNMQFRRFARGEQNHVLARDGTGFSIGIGSGYPSKMKGDLTPWMHEPDETGNEENTKARREFVRSVIDVNVYLKYIVNFTADLSKLSEHKLALRFDKTAPAVPGFMKAVADAYYAKSTLLEGLARWATEVVVPVPINASIMKSSRKGAIIRNALTTAVHRVGFIEATAEGIDLSKVKFSNDREYRAFLHSKGLKAWKKASGYGIRSIVECIIGCVKRLYGFTVRSRNPLRRVTEVGYKFVSFNFHRLTLLS